MQFSSRTISFLAVAFIVLSGIAYLLFSKHPSAPAPSASAVVPSDGSAPKSSAELTFLNLASQLDTISFDTTVLSDPRFLALVDIRTAILPEATGRIDPFATLPGLAKTK